MEEGGGEKVTERSKQKEVTNGVCPWSKKFTLRRIDDFVRGVWG